MSLFNVNRKKYWILLVFFASCLCSFSFAMDSKGNDKNNDVSSSNGDNKSDSDDEYFDALDNDPLDFDGTKDSNVPLDNNVSSSNDAPTLETGLEQNINSTTEKDDATLKAFENTLKIFAETVKEPSL